jgi:hypothetical protein
MYLDLMVRGDVLWRHEWTSSKRINILYDSLVIQQQSFTLDAFRVLLNSSLGLMSADALEVCL